MVANTLMKEGSLFVLVLFVMLKSLKPQSRLLHSWYVLLESSQ
jgi:hypothetical protein